MTLSLNEVQGLAQKAARGAGMDWGLAEEAGRATRWLAAHGLPGPALLAGLLKRNDGAVYADICPLPDAEGLWMAKGGTLCPITAGAAFCDRAAHWADGQQVGLGPVAFPLLALAHMAWAADATGTALTLTWPGVTLTRKHGQTHVMAATPADLTAPQVPTMTLAPASAAPGQPVTPVSRASIDPDTRATLDGFAFRTFAPETEERRRAGAGAGLTDND
jgi:hypothetical protein